MSGFWTKQVTFCGACSAVSPAWNDVFVSSSQPTTFPGTWRPRDERLISAGRPLFFVWLLD
eukprot:5447309-Heterocapsa_arctica.AAC.1